ncbi:ECF transporter S component, partial [Streptomyces sp. C1-2]|nr:ECF transporter S component [Streptomyces sp. C1-2]
ELGEPLLLAVYGFLAAFACGTVMNPGAQQPQPFEITQVAQ